MGKKFINTKFMSHEGKRKWHKNEEKREEQQIKLLTVSSFDYRLDLSAWAEANDGEFFAIAASIMPRSNFTALMSPG